MTWRRLGLDAVEALLAAATDACTVEHLPQRLRCGATLNAHTNWVETLQHDDEYMYSGSQDMTIRKWRRSDLHCEAVLKGHEKGVLSLKRATRRGSNLRLLTWHVMTWHAMTWHVMTCRSAR